MGIKRRGAAVVRHSADQAIGSSRSLERVRRRRLAVSNCTSSARITLVGLKIRKTLRGASFEIDFETAKSGSKHPSALRGVNSTSRH